MTRYSAYTHTRRRGAHAKAILCAMLVAWCAACFACVERAHASIFEGCENTGELSAASETVAYTAQGPVEQSCSLVLAQPEGSCASFEAYRVATWDENGHFIWTDAMLNAFDQAGQVPPDLDGMHTADECRNVARVVAHVVRLADMRPDYMLEPDVNGITSANGLAAGLYAVVGLPYSGNTYAFTFEPSLVGLPAYNAATNTWENSATIEPKYSKKPLQDPGTANPENPSAPSESNSPHAPYQGMNPLLRFVQTGDAWWFAACVAVGAIASAAVFRRAQRASRRKRD